MWPVLEPILNPDLDEIDVVIDLYLKYVIAGGCSIGVSAIVYLAW